MFWLLVLSCNGQTTDDSWTPTDSGPLRVAFISDTHVIGPQYECCSESDGIDNDSIMRSPDRLAMTIAQINAIDPPPERVFLLGDVVHAAHHGTDLAWYQAEESAFSVAAALFAELEPPLHILWGNHDYEVDCAQGPEHHERELSHQLFSQFFDAEPYDVIDTEGWRFLLTNSQLGPTWDVGNPNCDTSLGSFGEEQLAWLDQQLSDGKPSVVMSHHHMLTSIATNENAGSDPDLPTVLARHDNVAVHLAGHLHRWYDLVPSTLTPVRHIILGSTRYDADNFWLAEFESDGSFEILDYEKPEWQTTCANTWSYSGSPSQNEGTVEEGDCGF